MEDYYSIQTAEHHTSMFTSLHMLQKQGVLCDVILAAEDGEVMAHKVLLMAASSYFRERLSPVVSATASRIYLKGISVVELANLVKYIYTGRLLVAKDTMDVTLEVSEILGLNGVITGYQDIIVYERMRAGGERTIHSESDHTNSQPISGQDVHLAVPQEGSATLQRTVPISSPNSSTVDQAVPQNSEDIRVTEYCQDGSTVTYTVENTDGADIVTTSTGDYNFEFHPFEQQFVDVSAGISNQQSHTTSITSTSLQNSTTEDIVIDEQAQHQDLLSVAIEKLSGGSHNLIDNSNTVPSTSSNLEQHKLPSKTQEKYVNGKIDTKIVTLSAGKVNNELGGQTSVYTVALDPSTIKQPLKMPRFQRRKTDKERQAEQNAKRYRQKKAELIAGKSFPDTKTTLGQNVDVGPDFGTEIEINDYVDELEVQNTELPTDLVVPVNKHIQVNEFVNQDEGSLGLKIQEIQSCSAFDTLPKDHGVSDPVVDGDKKNGEDFSCGVNFDSDDNNDNGDLKKPLTKTVKDKTAVSNSPSTKKVNSRTFDIKYGKEGSAAIHKTSKKSGENMKGKKSKDDKVMSDTQETTSKNKKQNKARAEAQTDIKQCEENERSPDKMEEEREIAILDSTRSSASKRKGKVPRRLSLSSAGKASNKAGLNRRNIPLVRTRRYSRNEANATRKKFKSNSPDPDQVEIDKHGVDNNDSMLHNQSEYNENEDLNDKSPKNSHDTILVKRQMLPEIRLKKMSTKDVQAWNENVQARQTDNKLQLVQQPGETNLEPQSEDNQEEINAEIQTLVVGLSDDENDIKTKEKETTKQSGLKRKRVSIDTGKMKGKKAKTLTCEKGSEVLDSEDELSAYLQNSKSVESVAKVPTIPGHRKSPRKLEKSLTDREVDDAHLVKASKGMRTNANLDVLDDDSSMMYACPEDNCSFTSKDIGNVRRHRTSFHQITDSSSTSITSVIKQEPVGQKEVGHVCKCCGAIFRTKIAMKGHLKSRLVFGMCTCVYCKETFKKGSEFFNHLYQCHGIAGHTELKHFSCQKCKFIGFSNREMTVHNRFHEGKFVNCTKCPETFPTKKKMIKHLQTHTKSLDCSQCDYTADTRSSLMIHRKVKHSSQREEHMCQFCLYTTPLVGNLRKHMMAAHELIVVTKQSNYNKTRYKDYEEGTLLTKDGKVFDPTASPLPKVSNRIYKLKGEEEESHDNDAVGDSNADDSSKESKARRVPLMTLSPDEFTKEILKRHEEYLKKPEKVHRVMSKSLAVATAHPSFPQASPSVRVNKANKLYHTPKPKHSYLELTGSHSEQYAMETSLPSVVHEVEIPGHNVKLEETVGGRTEDVMVTLPTNLHVVIDKDGRKSLVDTMNVVNVLLEAGHQIQVEEEVEIQNE